MSVPTRRTRRRTGAEADSGGGADDAGVEVIRFAEGGEVDDGGGDGGDDGAAPVGDAGAGDAGGAAGASSPVRMSPGRRRATARRPYQGGGAGQGESPLASPGR